MEKISFIDNEKAMAIIDQYEKIQENKASGWTEEQLGLFLYEENGRWVAIDNRDGDAWTEDFAGAEVALKWLLDEYSAEEAHALDHGAPCKLGDSAFVFYHDDKTGLTHIDAFTVQEISNRRIWLGGDPDLYYWHNEIGKEVFLSPESAARYAEEHGMTLAPLDLETLIAGAEEKKETPVRDGSGRDFGER